MANRFVLLICLLFFLMTSLVGVTYFSYEQSILNFKQKNWKESLEYALKALDNLEAITSSDMKAAILDTVACAYQLNEDYVSASW